MTTNPPRVYAEGLRIHPDCQAQIDKIVEAVKALSRSSELSIKLLKSGRNYEGLLWGKADDQSIGAYNRGPSLPLVLETLQKKVQRQCLRSAKNRFGHHTRKPQTYQQPLEMAG
jgi:hypothetical protein